MLSIDADRLNVSINADALIDWLRIVPLENGMINPDVVVEFIREMPDCDGWISVKDGTPNEHDSIFAQHQHLSKYMWAKESDDVIVYVRFPDGSGRSTEGRLRDGKWHTKISPSLEPVVTHWMPMPKSPKEIDGE